LQRISKHVFTGFGFGPIQGGLFVDEAYASGNFSRIVIAEIDQTLVDAVRANGGSYAVNIARRDRVDVVNVRSIELLNPNVERDKNKLIEALSESTEIVTCLPSVAFYDVGANSVVSLLAQGLQQSTTDATVIYTAENNNRAAEMLEHAVAQKTGKPLSMRVQFLNTVIGKMSQVVTDPIEISQKQLATIAPGIERAFLVEDFNRILVTRCTVGGFTPGIQVFLEKDDVLAFEEAKLYGHNAIHALLAYLGAVKGYTYMTEVKNDPMLVKIARDAFLHESGASLIKKHKHLNDELFTPAGYCAYVDGLLIRMTNPYLNDTIERAGRDPMRKLGYDDRIFGAMRLAIEQGIEPTNLAVGALAGIKTLLKNAESNGVPTVLRFDPSNLDAAQIRTICEWLWQAKSGRCADRIIQCVQKAGLQS
jgi:mannitol-1-phosphate 5-dehydrogenase